MRMIFGNRVITLAIGAALGAAIIGGATFAFAGESAGPGPQPVDLVDEDSPLLRDGPCDGKHKGVMVGLHEIREVSGLDAGLFKEGLKAGKSINQVLTENGKEPAAIQGQVLDQIKTRLATKVADGSVTQAQADEALARSAERLPELMAATHTPGEGARNGRGKGDRLKGDHGLAGGLKPAAVAIGITLDELHQALKGGKTLAQVAQDHGIAPQNVIDAMVAASNSNIDRLVEAGKLDAARGAEAKTKAAEGITKFVNEGGPFGQMKDKIKSRRDAS